MRFTTYFELAMRQDPEIPEWDVMGRVWRIVHVGAKQSGVNFAVAFPRWMDGGFTFGKVLRVFCEGRDQADAVYDRIEKAPSFSDWADALRVRQVKEVSGYEAYLMHRIPSSPGNLVDKPGLDKEQYMQRRIESKARRIAQQRAFPYVTMRSSTGNGFRLVVERIGASESQNGIPNGYGLSRSTQIVAVPVCL